MNRKRSNLFLSLALPALLCLALASGCSSYRAKTCPVVGEGKDGVFIHLTRGPESPHRALMALQMAAIMAESRDVLVYCDIEAVKLLTDDAPNVEYSHFPGSHAQLKKLSAMGVRVMACPGCLKAADITPDQLRTGIEVAEKDAFFNFAQGRILTLDY